MNFYENIDVMPWRIVTNKSSLSLNLNFIKRKNATKIKNGPVFFLKVSSTVLLIRLLLC